jgi:fructokinase
MSESLFGAAQNCKNVVGIIMGTGFGSGVILNGELLRGAHGLAPELGHTILAAHGRLCLCGNRGCVEAYLSGPSILARYREAGGQTVFANATDLFSSTESIAQKVAEETLSLFTRFMAALVSMYDPEVVVLGGGLANEKSYYRREKEIAGATFGSRQALPIRPAQHGDASGKLGAAALFF